MTTDACFILNGTTLKTHLYDLLISGLKLGFYYDKNY